MKINPFYILTIVALLQSCSQTTTKTEEPNRELQSSNICSDSLFLAFCNDINSSQYKMTEGKLFQEHKLLKTDSLTGYIFNVTEKDYADTSKLETTEILFSVTPYFTNDSLKTIELVFNSIARHLPGNRIEFYNKKIRSIYESKYGKPETEETTSENKITYTWHSQNKVIIITEYFQLEWDILKKKNYKVLTPFKIAYEDKNHFLREQNLKKQSDKRIKTIETNKQNKTLNEI